MKTSFKQLESMAANIARLTGCSYRIESEPGGYQLLQIDPSGHGANAISPLLPSGQLWDWLRAYMLGLQAERCKGGSVSGYRKSCKCR
jgi:hypothetical protein